MCLPDITSFLPFLEMNINHHTAHHSEPPPVTMSIHIHRHPPNNYTQTLKRQQSPKMALPKLKTASLAPPPPPTLLDKLNSLDAKLKVYGPVLKRLFEFTMLTSLGTLAIVAVATALLGGSGLALYLLVQVAKMAIS